jgi:hypothetical protein
MKRAMVVLVMATVAWVASLCPVAAQAGPNLIIAGKRIGHVHLGRYGEADLAKLPDPDASDSGMGRDGNPSLSCVRRLDEFLQ